MPKLVYEKMLISDTSDVLVLNGPKDAIDSIQLPNQYSVSAKTTKRYDHIILFVLNKSELNEQLSQNKPLIQPTGKLWVAWPKAGKLDTDLNIKEVIRIGYDQDLVESTNLRIDDTWTALKFTHPKPGKKYNNSYGTLKSQP